MEARRQWQREVGHQPFHTRVVCRLLHVQPSWGVLRWHPASVSHISRKKKASCGTLPSHTHTDTQAHTSGTTALPSKAVRFWPTGANRGPLEAPQSHSSQPVSFRGRLTTTEMDVRVGAERSDVRQ